MGYNIVHDMDYIRSLCSTVHSIRKDLNLPTTQPLMSMTIYKGQDLDGLMFSLYKRHIEDECNIKSVTWDYIEDEDYEKYRISNLLTLNFREAGPLLGKNTQTVANLFREGKYEVKKEGVFAGDFVVPRSMVNMSRTVHNHLNLDDSLYVLPLGSFSFFVLDVMVYSGLYMEMLSSGVTKSINSHRKTSGFSITDDVNVFIRVPHEFIGVSKSQWKTVEKNSKSHIISMEYWDGDVEIIEMKKI